MTEKDIGKSVAKVASVLFLIAIISLILQAVLSNDAFSNIDATGTITNETITGITNVTNKTLSIKVSQPTASCTLTTLNNATDGQTLTSGNYTFYPSDCNIILTNTSAYIGEDVNATYGYTYGTNNTLSGINSTDLKNKFSAFVTAIIALFVVGGTILGVLWLLPYIKPLFQKNSGLNMAA